MSRRKAVKDTRERCVGAKTVESSAIGEVAPRTTVRISDVDEVGNVQYVEKHNKHSLPCCSRSVLIHGKSRKRRMAVSLVVTKKLSVESPSVGRPSFKAALEKSFEKSGARRSGRDGRNAPVFHGGN